MKNKRSLIFGIVGIIILFATIIIYAITWDSNASTSYILGFCFMIFAELVLFGGLIGIEVLSRNSSQIIIRTGCGGSLIAYSFVVFVSSWIYMISDTDKVKSFWVLQVALFAVLAISITIFCVTSRSVKEKDSKILESVTRVNEMVDSLKLLESNDKYGKQLLKLAEELRFTDVSSKAEVDDEIEAKIAKIEMSLVKDEKAESVEGIIDEIAVLIKKRKVQVRDTKVGGI